MPRAFLDGWPGRAEMHMCAGRQCSEELWEMSPSRTWARWSTWPSYHLPACSGSRTKGLWGGQASFLYAPFPSTISLSDIQHGWQASHAGHTAPKSGGDQVWHTSSSLCQQIFYSFCYRGAVDLWDPFCISTRHPHHQSCWDTHWHWRVELSGTWTWSCPCRVEDMVPCPQSQANKPNPSRIASYHPPHSQLWINTSQSQVSFASMASLYGKPHLCLLASKPRISLKQQALFPHPDGHLLLKSPGKNQCTTFPSLTLMLQLQTRNRWAWTWPRMLGEANATHHRNGSTSWERLWTATTCCDIGQLSLT